MIYHRGGHDSPDVRSRVDRGSNRQLRRREGGVSRRATGWSKHALRLVGSESSPTSRRACRGRRITPDQSVRHDVRRVTASRPHQDRFVDAPQGSRDPSKVNTAGFPNPQSARSTGAARTSGCVDPHPHSCQRHAVSVSKAWAADRLSQAIDPGWDVGLSRLRSIALNPLGEADALVCRDSRRQEASSDCANQGPHTVGSTIPDGVPLCNLF